MKKRLLKLGMALLAFGFWACDKECNDACPNPFDSDRGSNAKEAAEKMKPLLKELVDGQNYKSMGFHSVEEVGRVEIGKSISRIRLRCDSVQAYQATKGDDLSSFSISEQAIFPLLVDKKARAVLVVDSIPEPEGRSKLDWITVSFGNPLLATLIDTTIGESVKMSDAARNGYSLVDFPALGMTFFRHPMQDQTVLTLAKKMGSSCWADSLPMTRPLTDVLTALAECVKTDNLCSDEHLMSKDVDVVMQDSLAPPKKLEKKSAK